MGFPASCPAYIHMCIFSLLPHLLQDEAYAAAGATLGSAEEALGQDVVLKIREPGGRAGRGGQGSQQGETRGMAPWSLASPFPRITPLQPLPARADVGKEVPLLKRGATLVSFVHPAQHPALVEALGARGLTVLGEGVGRKEGPAG